MSSPRATVRRAARALLLLAGCAWSTALAAPPPPDHARAAASACRGCHVDPHGEQFAARPCAACHTTAAFRPSTIDALDHARIGVALVGGHAPADCAACHRAGRYLGTPRACGACHADPHQGRLGADCARCHFEDRWADVAPFDHRREAGLALEGGHGGLACAACHLGRVALRVARPATCRSCHSTTGPRGHGASLGSDCARCHTTTRFSEVRPFDHRRTLFPLERRHGVLPCAACHTPERATVPPDCRGCHGDSHRGRAGLECAACHRADSWLVIRFDHDRTGFRLSGAHFRTPCRSCHTSDQWAGLPRECLFCHRGDRVRADSKSSTHRAYSYACNEPRCHSAFNWNVSLYRR